MFLTWCLKYNKARLLSSCVEKIFRLISDILSRLRSGNACYHSVQNLLSSRLLFNNLKFKIYRTIILPVFVWVSNLVADIAGGKEAEGI